MGSSQSARKLTIANEEDDVNVITISEAVAKRLAESASQQPAVIAQKVTTASVATATTVAAAVPARASLPPQQLAEGYPQYTMSALAMQQKKNTELAEQETYWKQRMQNLEKTHEKINRAIDDEYKKALTIFDDCRVIKAQDAVKPCNENKQKVLKCYQDNPKETLRCADLVQQFSNCVDQRRAQLIRCN